MTKKTHPLIVWILVAIQFICSLFFVFIFSYDLFGLGKQPIPWNIREAMEIGAVLGLVLGSAMATSVLISTHRRNLKVEKSLKAASGEFNRLLLEHFDEWALSPTEHEVAYLAVKGLSNKEISDVLNKSEGTVKAQMNAIYRKAGVTGRPQLLSSFIEELMAENVHATAGRA